MLPRRPRWWDGALWWRVHVPGGYDGWRTIAGRRMTCDTMFAAQCAPHLRGEIRLLTRKPRR